MLAVLVIALMGCNADEATTLAANKSVVARWAQLEDQGLTDQLGEVASSDCVIHYPGGGETRGLDAIKAGDMEFAAAFSERRRDIQAQIAEGDLVLTRYVLTAKHTGEYMGIAPTGRTFTMSFMDLCRVSEGKVLECWVEGDMTAFYQQLTDTDAGAGEGI